MIQDARLANILSPIGRQLPYYPMNMPSAPPNMDTAQPANNSDMDPDLIAMFSQFQPKTDMNQQFNTAIASMPNRADYQPSRTRSILAALAGLGSASPTAYHGGAALGFNPNMEEGEKITRGIRDEPYNRALGDWKQKLEPIKEGAQMENTRNINERVAANDIISRVLQQRGLQRQINKDADNKKIADEKIEIQRKRAEVYDFKSRHPEYKSYIDEKGMLVFVNPSDPSKVVKTEINTGDLSDTEKINLEVKGRLKEIAATGAAAIKTKEATPGKNTTPTATPTKLPTEKKVETTKTGAEPNFLGKLMGKEAPTTKTTTITTTGAVGTTNGTDPKRQRAIDELTKAKKPITEANIKYVMDQLGK